MSITLDAASRLLCSRDDLLLLTHCRPDGDTVGSAAALCLALRKLGKTAYVAPNEEAHALFTPYLEAVTAPPDFVPGFVLSVDMASENMLTDSAARWRGRIDLSLDHHGSNEYYASATCVEPHRAACGELIYDLISLWGPVTAELALLLYVAIATDTGCFVYSNTTPATHRIAAALMETGMDAAGVNKRHFRTKSLVRLKLESKIVTDMEVYDGGATVVAPVTLAAVAELGATEGDLEDIAAFAGQLAGVKNAITLRELRPGVCKLSLRTGPELDASAVCALLGGGGHPAASGCTVRGTVREAVDAMLDAIRQVRHG